MGQWGESMFESDGVLDFLAEFKDSNDFSLIENAINTVLESEDYIDVDDCYALVASAEIVAAVQGNKSEEFPDDLDFKSSSFQEKINIDLINALEKALKKVLLQEGSELFELWENEDFFKDYYEDLVKRVS